MAARGESARGSRVIKVVVADSSALFRSGMRRAIEAEPDLKVVGEADHVEQVAEVAAASRPDVIVVGALTPSNLATWRSVPAAWVGGRDRYLAEGVVGAEPRVAERIPGDTRHRCALVAVVDTRDGGRDVLDAVMDVFAAGVLGCLDRSADPEDLVCAIRAASRGRQFASPQVLKVLVEGLARLREVASGFEEAVVHAMASPAKAGSPAYAAAESCSPLLTPREREVLSLVARGKSNRDIASMLSISEKTVKNHVSHLLHKLGADRRTQAAIWAISQGLSGPVGSPLGSQDGGTMTKVPSKNESSD
ncbi:MAG: LuxR C-terminal-related transcriptional regulator [Betaproteobacteria bacterium]